MHRSPLYLAVTIAGFAWLATGCTGPATRPEPPAPHATQPRTVAQPAPASTAAPPTRGATGIPACDAYLASYKACHRAAGIYAPDTIDRHYRIMRHTLRKESRDPAKRPTLEARCQSLAHLLKQALHGKSCDFRPSAAQPADGH